MIVFGCSSVWIRRFFLFGDENLEQITDIFLCKNNPKSCDPVILENLVFSSRGENINVISESQAVPDPSVCGFDQRQSKRALLGFSGVSGSWFVYFSPISQMIFIGSQWSLL